MALNSTAFWTCRPTWNRATPIPRPPTMSILPWTHDRSFGKHPYDKKINIVNIKQNIVYKHNCYLRLIWIVMVVLFKRSIFKIRYICRLKSFCDFINTIVFVKNQFSRINLHDPQNEKTVNSLFLNYLST